MVKPASEQVAEVTQMVGVGEGATTGSLEWGTTRDSQGHRIRTVKYHFSENSLSFQNP